MSSSPLVLRTPSPRNFEMHHKAPYISQIHVSGLLNDLNADHPSHLSRSQAYFEWIQRQLRPRRRSRRRVKRVRHHDNRDEIGRNWWWRWWRGIMSQVERRWIETIEGRRSCWGSNLVEWGLRTEIFDFDWLGQVQAGLSWTKWSWPHSLS